MKSALRKLGTPQSVLHTEVVPGFSKAPPLIDAPRPARILAAGGVCVFALAGAFAFSGSRDEPGLETAKPGGIQHAVPAAVAEPPRLGSARGLPPLGEVRVRGVSERPVRAVPANPQAQSPVSASAEQAPPEPAPAPGPPLAASQPDPATAPAAPAAPEPDSPPLLFDDSG
jgi:hypothetical protein